MGVTATANSKPLLRRKALSKTVLDTTTLRHSNRTLPLKDNRPLANVLSQMLIRIGQIADTPSPSLY